MKKSGFSQNLPRDFGLKPLTFPTLIPLAEANGNEFSFPYHFKQLI
jgi:hypothetical protein